MKKILPSVVVGIALLGAAPAFSADSGDLLSCVDRGTFRGKCRLVDKKLADAIVEDSIPREAQFLVKYDFPCPGHSVLLGVKSGDSIKFFVQGVSGALMTINGHGDLHPYDPTPQNTGYLTFYGGCRLHVTEVTVLPIGVPVELLIGPDAGRVGPGGHLVFTAWGGSGTGYAWSLSSNASGGSIDAVSGAYTAGATGDVTDVVQIRDSLGNVATQSVQVGAVLAITPSTAIMAPGATATFTAAGGSGAGFVWSLAVKPSGGSIDATTGTYVAGPNGGVTDVVQVRDSQWNVAAVEIQVSAGLSIAPDAGRVGPRGQLVFSASGGSGTGYAWSLATDTSGGSIDAASGAYTAGATGDVTDVVQVRDSLGNVATRKVQVGAALAITPSTSTMASGATATFTAAGGSGSGFVWSLSANPSGAIIDATAGTYVAGPTGGVTDRVQVTDSTGNTATTEVSVLALPAGSGCGATTSSTPMLGLGLGLVVLLRRRWAVVTRRTELEKLSEPWH